MASFISSAPQKEAINVRQFNICQYDLLGSTQVCTAIAVVAARELHKANGNFDAVFRTDSQVMEILSEGVVWHSRWLALDTNGTRTAFEADTESEDADPNLVSMATPDEICALPNMCMDVTDVRYEGTLIPQSGREHFGISVTEAVNFIFFPPERKSFSAEDKTPVHADGTQSVHGSDPAAAESKANGEQESSQTNGHSTSGAHDGSARRTHSAQGEATQQQTKEQKSSIKKLVSDFSIFGKGGENKADDKVDTYIFTSRGYSTLIARKGRYGMVFDSHQRDKRGMANKEEGKAVCVFCDGPNSLSRYLRALYGTKPLSLFTLQQVVPKQCTEEMQYGATSTITKSVPHTPPPTPQSVTAMAANAGTAAATRIAELGTSLKRLGGLGSSWFKDG